MQAGQIHLVMQTDVEAERAHAAAQIPFLLDAMRSDVQFRGLQLSDDRLPLPTGMDEARYEDDGIRVLVGYQPWFYCGEDEAGEPLYKEGWIARVDALCVAT